MFESFWIAIWASVFIDSMMSTIISGNSSVVLWIPLDNTTGGSILIGRLFIIFLSVLISLLSGFAKLLNIVII